MGLWRQICGFRSPPINIKNFPAMTSRKNPSEAVLKLVFLYVKGSHLCRCMLVCKLWRDILCKDDYIARCLILRYHPALCKPESSVTNIRQVLSCKLFDDDPRRKSPRLSVHDLEFYLDIWSDDEQRLIFSRPVPLHTLEVEGVRFRKTVMLLQVEPRLTVRRPRSINVSLLVGRRGSDQVACLIRKSVAHNVVPESCIAEASEDICFSPNHPFAAPTRAIVGLVFEENGGRIDVFRVEFSFYAVPSDENVNDPDLLRRMFYDKRDYGFLGEEDVLRLLDILDWK